MRFIEDHPLDVLEALTKAAAVNPLVVIRDDEIRGRGPHFSLGGGALHRAFVGTAGAEAVFTRIVVFQATGVVAPPSQIDNAHALELVEDLVLEGSAIRDVARSLFRAKGVPNTHEGFPRSGGETEGLDALGTAADVVQGFLLHGAEARELLGEP
jgi:hypothetical protein